MTSYTFDQLLDFTRTTSGTFVGSNGLIQTTPASVNLLTFTQQFDNAVWSKNAATVTANSTVAPDGTSTADTLVETAVTTTHRAKQSVSTIAAGVITTSVYAKAAGRSRIVVTNESSVANDGVFAVFNLFTGVIDVLPTTYGSGFSATSASIESVGNGWFRCSVTANYTGTNRAISCNLDNATSGAASQNYTGDGTSGIFVWGAQLEVGSTATTYTRNNGGVYPARFDYDPATLAPKGILIEEQRTNITPYSAATSANWGATGGTIANTGKLSPDGSANMLLFTEDTANSGHRCAVNGIPAVIVSGTTYTASIYLAAGTRRYVVINAGNPGSGWGVTVDTTNWTLNGYSVGGGLFQSATVTAVGNGIYRVTVTGNQFAGGGIPSYVIVGGSLVSSATRVDTAYLGTGGTFFAWGAQFESGSFATSYIPTVASQVTRAADQCAIVAPMFAPWYNQAQGTFVMDTSPVNNGCYALAATDGTANEEIILRYASTGSAAVVRDGGTIQANFGTGVLTGKNALAYNTNDFAVSTNGGAAATDTSGTVPTNNQVSLGRAFDGSLNINGHIRSVQYYPVRLADFQLQAITA